MIIFIKIIKYFDSIIDLSFARNLGKEKIRKERLKDTDCYNTKSISNLYRNYEEGSDKIISRIIYLAIGKNITLEELAEKYNLKIS